MGGISVSSVLESDTGFLSEPWLLRGEGRKILFPQCHERLSGSQLGTRFPGKKTLGFPGACDGDHLLALPSAVTQVTEDPPHSQKYGRDSGVRIPKGLPGLGLGSGTASRGAEGC